VFVGNAGESGKVEGVDGGLDIGFSSCEKVVGADQALRLWCNPALRVIAVNRMNKNGFPGTRRVARKRSLGIGTVKR
jgi:hypothetical protein